MTLTATDLDLIRRARELADAHDVDGLRKVTLAKPDTDYAMVVADALGAAQYVMLELARIAERLDGEVSRLRNDRARYRIQLGLGRDDDDREALAEAGQPSRCGDHHASGVTNCTREAGHDGAHHNGSGLTWGNQP